MKNLVALLIVFFAVSGVFIFSRPEQNNIPIVTTSPNHYITSGNELEITLTPEFSVMKSQDPNGSIFIATSSQDLLMIRKVVDEEPTDFTQQEAVDVVYEEFKNITVQNDGDDTRVWSGLGQGKLGENTFLFRNAIRTRLLNGQEIKERVRQYVTYNNGALYFITYQNFFPDADKSAYWDGIVSSVVFK